MADLTKRAYQNTEFTNEQLLEFSKCMDPYYFLNNYFTIQHPTKGSMIYKAYSYQDELVNSYHNYRYSCNGSSDGQIPKQDIFFGMYNPTRQFLLGTQVFGRARNYAQNSLCL